MDWKVFLFTLLVLYGISLLAYMGIKRFVINKYNIKKKYLLILMVAMLVIQVGITALFPASTITQFIFTILFVIAVLVLMDVVRKEREFKNRPVVGRPKPKPNKSNNSK